MSLEQRLTELGIVLLEAPRQGQRGREDRARLPRWELTCSARIVDSDHHASDNFLDLIGLQRADSPLADWVS